MGFGEVSFGCLGRQRSALHSALCIGIGPSEIRTVFVVVASQSLTCLHGRIMPRTFRFVWKCEPIDPLYRTGRFSFISCFCETLTYMVDASISLLEIQQHRTVLARTLMVTCI